jgi:pimeloyl-ACP methyl ester carboxylesterase
MFATQQVPPEAADAYLAVLSVPEAMEAAVNWYRAANGLASATVPNCPVPTLYLWGDQDVSVGRTAFELTREHVDAPYVAVVLEGRHHFLSDETPEVNGHIIGHLQRAVHAA